MSARGSASPVEELQPSSATGEGGVEELDAAPLRRLLDRERRRRQLGAALDVAAGGLLAGSALAWSGLPALWCVVAAAAGSAAAFWFGGWGRPGALRPTLSSVARHLDITLGSADWSSELLTRPRDSLSPLGRLQRARVLEALSNDTPRLPRSTWRRPLVRLTAAALSAIVALSALLLGRGSPAVRWRPQPTPRTAAAARPAPAILGAHADVVPPAYTRLPPHRATGWAVEAEEGARLRFSVTLRGDIASAALHFDDQNLPLTRDATGSWSGMHRAVRSELYALQALTATGASLRGPVARLDVRLDQPPTLEVVRPRPITTVPAEAPGQLALDVVAQDDYGVVGVDASLVVAHGNGEQVTFREIDQALTRGTGGHYTGALDLAKAGFGVGVEGYLRFEARDNREPVAGRTRSATLRVSAPQTGLAKTASLGGGIVLQPLLEMFRSERQIILDTRQLLREAPHLKPAEVERRAQDLGFDQRALRLRYGALLGEEVESGVAVEGAEAEVRAIRPPTASGSPGERGAVKPPAEDSDAPPPHAAAPIGASPGPLDRAAALAQALPPGMVHLHDSAASAGSFPDEVRRGMREVLTEMWGAEGRLRGIQPREALPFEERALRKLKEVQQTSRAYVAKLGFEAPEIDLTRRLSGDLQAITAQKTQRAASADDPLRRLFSWSQAACGTPPPAPPALALRVAGEQALSRAALAGDLEALRALTLWRAAAQPGCQEAQALRAPLWRLLTPPAAPIHRLEAER